MTNWTAFIYDVCAAIGAAVLGVLLSLLIVAAVTSAVTTVSSHPCPPHPDAGRPGGEG